MYPSYLAILITQSQVDHLTNYTTPGGSLDEHAFVLSICSNSSTISPSSEERMLSQSVEEKSGALLFSWLHSEDIFVCLKLKDLSCSRFFLLSLTSTCHCFSILANALHFTSEPICNNPMSRHSHMT